MKLILTIIIMSVVILLLIFFLILSIKGLLKIKKEMKSLETKYTVMKRIYLENEEQKKKLYTGNDTTDFNNSIELLQKLAERQ